MTSSPRRGLGIAAVLALVAVSVPADAAQVQRYPLMGPDATLYCDTLEPAFDPDAPDRGPGYVRFRVQDGVVSAVVVLRRAQPNVEYYLRLLQGSISDCTHLDGTVVTDRRGRARIRLSEPDVGTRAQVMVFTGADEGEPMFRASTYFETNE